MQRLTPSAVLEHMKALGYTAHGRTWMRHDVLPDVRLTEEWNVFESLPAEVVNSLRLYYGRSHPPRGRRPSHARHGA